MIMLLIANQGPIYDLQVLIIPQYGGSDDALIDPFPSPNGLLIIDLRFQKLLNLLSYFVLGSFDL